MIMRPGDLRKYSRHSMQRAAEIIFGAHRPRVSCRIWDMSDGGARLSISHPMRDMSRHFTLSLFRDSSVQRDCEVVWTDGRYIGVKFISEWYGALRRKRQLAPAELRRPSLDQ
jgi:PilZ domain